MKRVLTIPILFMLAALSALAQNSYLLKAGSLTASNAGCTATACVAMPVTTDVGSVVVQLAGTWTATVQFEGSLDMANYVAVPAVPIAGGAAVTSATAGGVWMVNAGGLRSVRARVSAFTSGTVTTTITRSPMIPTVNNVSLTGTITPSAVASTGAISGTTGTFTGAVSGTAVKPAQVALTSSSGTAAMDLSLGNSFKITLSENTTLTATNLSAGQAVSALICQNGTGNFTFTWPASFKGGMTVAATASKCNAQRFVCDASACWATAAGSTGM